MPPKGSIQPDSAMTNLFRLKVNGLEITATRVGGWDRMLTIATLPDQTQQSTGQINPIDSIEVDVPAHHDAENLFLEGLFTASITGAIYKGLVQVDSLSSSGAVKRSVSWIGAFVRGKKEPERDSGSDGEGLVTTWVFACDDVVPL